MRFGICTDSHNARNAARLGYDFIEIGAAELCPEGPESDWAPVRERILESGLSAEALGRVFPGEVRLVGPDRDMGRIEAYVATAFARVAEVGGRVVAWGSPDARRVPDGYPHERALRELGEVVALMGRVAATNGLIVAVEPLASTRTNVIWTVRHGLEMVRRLQHPAVHTMADIYQMYLNDEPLQEMARAGSDLAHVHVSDPDRLPPGNPAHLPFYREAFDVLREMGYDGRVCIEARVTDFTLEAERALAFLKGVCASDTL